MFCTKCGKPVSGGSFCTSCGNRLNPVEVQPPQPPQPKADQRPGGDPNRNKKPPVQKIKKKKEKKSNPDRVGTIVSVISIIVILLCIALMVVYFMWFFPGNRVTLTEFSADNPYLLTNTPQDVVFTVKSKVGLEEITLYQGEKSIGTMKDNGKKADAVADDGIYTCEVELEKESDKLRSSVFHCKYEFIKSEELEIFFFPALDEESAEQAREDYIDLSEEIQDIEEDYCDRSGYVPEEDYEALFKEITAELDEAVEDDMVLHYYVEGNSIYVKMKSGLALIYAPKQENMDAVGEDVSMTISTFQPCFTQMGGSTYGSTFTGYTLPSDVDFMLEMLDVSGQNLKEALPNYSFPNSHNMDDAAVTLEAIRSIGENQVVLWHGHGYYGPVVKSCLVTGEPFDWDAWWWDIGYYADCVSNRIVNSALLGYDEVIISSKYIEKYCGDMDNTFVYLAACSSGKDPALANAFTDKGAVVVANTESIIRDYNVAMLYGTVNQMLKIDPETTLFYTLEDALEIAKGIYGRSDADSRYGGGGATPMIFGTSAGEYRFCETVPTGTISGKVCKASDRVTAIADAQIEVLIDGVSFRKVRTGADGHYEIELPVGACQIQISAEGYITFLCYNDVRAGSTTYMETFLMVDGEETQNGEASGRVVNSLTGYGAPNVSLTVKQNWNNTDPLSETLLTTTTDNDGYYHLQLPCGNYTVIAEKEGYTPSSFNIVVLAGGAQNQDGTITPEINGNDYLITLTWGENPRDVDSHMVGTLSDGSWFHVFYGDKEQRDDGVIICNLDYDDVQSYGPEHITLTANTAQPYYYYLHRYAGSGYLSTSGAKVTVEQGNMLIAEFHVPTNLGNHDYWNVFAIKDGEIIICNTITTEPDLSYAE